MLKKIWDNIEIILITLSMLLAMFTIGLMVGVYVSSNTIEELSNDNIVKERTIQQQKERIRELQLLKQYKEIYNA
nr:MAG TPA: cell division protein [Caudoviricetes sp.]